MAGGSLRTKGWYVENLRKRYILRETRATVHSASDWGYKEELLRIKPRIDGLKNPFSNMDPKLGHNLI